MHPYRVDIHDEHGHFSYSLDFLARDLDEALFYAELSRREDERIGDSIQLADDDPTFDMNR